MDTTEFLYRLLNSGQAPHPGVGGGMPQTVGMAAAPPMPPVQTDQAAQAPSPQPTPQPAQGGGIGELLSSLFAPRQSGRNETIQWLTTQGYDPGAAKVIASDKGALRSVILGRGKGKASPFDQRAQAAQQYGLDPNSEEGRNFILSGNLPEARGGAAELGLNPQYGVDEATGNPVLLQLGKDGKVVKSALPEGVTLSKQPIKLDAGTYWVLLDPITRQPVGQIPKNLAGAEAEKALGKQQGEQLAAAPQDIIAAQNALDLIDSIRNDPYKARGTGLSSVLNIIPGSGGYDFENKVQGAKSGAFLTAIQQMRGLGSLSDAEGRAATSAINRMNTATSVQEFDAALSDYEKIVRQGMGKAQRRLKGDFNSTLSAPSDLPAATAAPQQREIKSIRDLSNQELEAIINGQ